MFKHILYGILAGGAVNSGLHFQGVRSPPGMPEADCLENTLSHEIDVVWDITIGTVGRNISEGIWI